jgi:hypothetical protein
MIPEDIGTPASWLVTKPTIRFGPSDDAACTRLLAPETDASDKRFVLFGGKSTWELDAQLFEELRGVDTGKFFQPAADDWPHHAECLDTGLARLGVNRPRFLLHLRECRGGWC